jgi:hypothetical protein
MSQQYRRSPGSPSAVRAAPPQNRPQTLAQSEHSEQSEQNATTRTRRTPARLEPR